MKIYLRIGQISKYRQKYKITASTNENLKPLDNGSKYRTIYYPTISLQIELNIDQTMFESAKLVIQEKISKATIASAFEAMQTDTTTQ